jgi:hypothetical protein
MYEWVCHDCQHVCNTPREKAEHVCLAVLPPVEPPQEPERSQSKAALGVIGMTFCESRNVRGVNCCDDEEASFCPSCYARRTLEKLKAAPVAPPQVYLDHSDGTYRVHCCGAVVCNGPLTHRDDCEAAPVAPEPPQKIVSQADLDRVRLGEQVLFSGIVAVLFPDGEHWCIQSREIDYCSGAPTKEQAFTGFKLGFIADVLLHMNPRIQWPKPSPEDVWNELTTRDGAELLKFYFTNESSTLSPSDAGYREKVRQRSNMETGEFHNVDGWYYKRMEDGAVRIRKRATAHDDAPVVAEVTIPENEWASIVAHVTKSGETGESWQAARNFHAT